MLDNLKTDC